MSNTSGMAADDALLTMLNGIPPVDFPANVRAAMTAGRRMTSILADVVSLRRGPGQLVPAEFFYYRLWEPGLTREDKQRFVGKQAQTPCTSLATILADMPPRRTRCCFRR
jgi:hypothetical protein